MHFTLHQLFFHHSALSLIRYCLIAGDMGRYHGYDRLRGSSTLRQSGRDSGLGKRRDRDSDSDRDYHARDSSSRKKTYYQPEHRQETSSYQERSKDKRGHKRSHSDAPRDQHSDSSSTRHSRDSHRKGELSKPSPPAPVTDPTVSERLNELKAKFSKICFDGLKFLPAIHPIPGDVKQNAIACTNDVYVQHDAFVHLAEKLSEVSMERQHEIDRLKLEAIHDRDIIKAQDEEIAAYKSELEATRQSAKDTAEAVSRLELTHKKELDEAVQRCGALALEKDSVQKERDTLSYQVKELEEQLFEERKEKVAAQVEAQHYCDEIVATRLLKGKLEDDLSKVEALRNEAREEGKRAATVDIDSRLEAAREEGREEIKTEFDPLIAEFNARVLMHRDLTFLGDGYLESLAEAWETLIQIRKVESGADEVDEEALIKEFLRGK